MIDLQNNDITEIKEDDFKGLNKLYVREIQLLNPAGQQIQMEDG